MTKPQLLAPAGDFASVDAALDLLQTHPNPRLNLLRTILDLAEFFQERRLADLARHIDISPKLLDIIKYFLIHTEKIARVGDYLDSFGAYLKEVLEKDILLAGEDGHKHALPRTMRGLELFTPEERTLLETYLTRVKADGVLLHVNRLILFLAWSSDNVCLVHHVRCPCTICSQARQP